MACNSRPERILGAAEMLSLHFGIVLQALRYSGNLCRERQSGCCQLSFRLEENLISEVFGGDWMNSMRSD
jgi:hypothetical protein